MTDLFTIASREKFRFESTKGSLTVEDLWDIPLTSERGAANLDDIARGLHRQLKSDDTVSFVRTAVKVDTTIQQKLDLVKAIIEVRITENAAAQKKRDNATRRQQIMAIIADREANDLRATPVDDLRKLLEDMQD